VWRAAGDRQGEAFATSFLGRLAARAGRCDEAMELLATARSTFVEIRADAEVLEVDAFTAEALMFSGRFPDALERATDALAREGGRGAHAPLLHRIRAYALLATGDVDGCAAAVEESLTVARARGADYDIALALRAAAALARARGRQPDPAAERERIGILERLGVVREPAILADDAPRDGEAIEAAAADPS
jgi:hypothetical protein